MIDLHTHSIFSDGALIPSELVHRAEVLGVKAIGITDHGDVSNVDFIIPRLVDVCQELNRVNQIKALPGIELTHVPPSQIGPLAKQSRSLGAKIVVVHGETIAEPVAPGTNRAALEADIDILAHPGFISIEDVLMAAKKGVFLEITARKGHSLTNGYVAQLAKAHGAKMVLNSDAHAPSDLVTLQWAKKVALGAGLTETDFEGMQKNAETLL
ncbi:MAG: histidinol phosphate phosphatase domain-containing protein [Thermodesulfobacteriota bacterium]|nr:histidinol phosphate phosphatase domain-containing protein [Thermodesulfobacteriota bacterium]